MKTPITAPAEKGMLPRKKYLVTFGYFLSFIGLGLVCASLGPTLPGLAAQTNSKIQQISFLFTARSFGYLAGSFIGGRLYDRFSGRIILVLTILLMGSFMALVPLTGSLILLLFIFGFVGANQGMLDVGGNTLIVWLHGSKVGPFMNGLHFSFGIGAFLSPIIIAQVITIEGAGPAYWILASLLIIPVLWFIPLPQPHPAHNISTTNNHQKNPRFLYFLMLFFFVYPAFESGFGGWIFTYTIAMKLGDPAAAAYLTSIFWGTLTFGRFLAILLAIRFQPRTILTANLIGIFLGLATILLWPYSKTALWIGTAIFGTSIASIFPMNLAWAEQNMTISGRVNGLFFMSASAGGMLFPVIFGQLFAYTGPQAIMMAIFIDTILAAGIFGGLILNSKK
jgi:FHS family Na+ dependent glucose MFS transporter 1